MGDYISELSDDVLSFILSYLTLKDAVRMRLLSRRWRYLSPPHSLLQFDAPTVFGIGDNTSLSKIVGCSSQFVAAVDQLLLHRGIPHIGTLRVRFPLAKAFCFHIDRWVEVSISKEAEKIDFDFFYSFDTSKPPESYNFPCHLLPADGTTRFKHLSLKSCTFGLSSEFTRLNCLSTLNLTDVPLHQSGLDGILGNGLNLKILRLINCDLENTKLCLHGQLPLLKTLALEGSVFNCVEIDSINLETLEFNCWSHKLDFINVPCLKQVSLRGMSLLQCSTFAADVPELRRLFLIINIFEVETLPRSSIRFHGLKLLDLLVTVAIGSDLMCITYLLNASPCLEILHLWLGWFVGKPNRAKRNYIVQKHLHLKEVEIKNFQGEENEMELAICLLRNTIALEHMDIHGVSKMQLWRNADLKRRVDDGLQKEKINPTAKLIVL